MKHVYVISDATGGTAERILRETLLHYNDSDLRIAMHTGVRVGDDMRRIVEQAGQQGALVVYTIVSSDARKHFDKLVHENDVRSVDLIGQLMRELGSFLGQEPTGAPGLLHAIGDDNQQRTEAFEFMMAHDDGAEPHDLPTADLVLVGISRTTKTPLSAYMAQRGVRVANVPIVLGIDPPTELSKCDPNRVYALTIAPDALVRIRGARLKHMGMEADSSYGQLSHIVKELAYAKECFAQGDAWPIFDVTNKAVEENAADILKSFDLAIA